ncbi:MAG: Type secretion system protein [Verrucomicrobiota bacterium]
MNESFQQFFQSGPLEGLVALVICFLLYVVAGLLPLLGVVYVIYFLLTLPMRRNERARIFLDLLELGLRNGHTPEAAILGPSQSHDHSLSVRFHLLAAHLEKGFSLHDALEQVPRLVPPQINAMLQTGGRIGDLSKVLPACRQFLNDGVSHVRGALNYVILLMFVVTPFAVFVPIVMRVKVLPAFKQVFEGMLEGPSLPAFTRLVLDSSDVSTAILIAIILFLWVLMAGYVGGPRLLAWLRRAAPGLPDRIFYHLPWRRKRMQRDFSSMLAVLLDAQVPEPEAVSLAGESTANSSMILRARKTCARLKAGIRLPEAIGSMDDSKELQWRLSNALGHGGGFLRALTGWHEALDAKAFQLEQTAAQITTTFLVLFNGLIVACIVIAIFLALIELINQATLW